jgi:hypothetical protein
LTLAAQIRPWTLGVLGGFAFVLLFYVAAASLLALITGYGLKSALLFQPFEFLSVILGMAAVDAL